MGEDSFKKSESYHETRNSFEDLGVEEQAVFIVESAVNMIVKSVRRAGDAFARAFEDITIEAEEAAEEPVGEKKSSGAGRGGSKKKGGAKSGSDKSKSGSGGA